MIMPFFVFIRRDAESMEIAAETLVSIGMGRRKA